MNAADGPDADEQGQRLYVLRYRIVLFLDHESPQRGWITKERVRSAFATVPEDAFETTLQRMHADGIVESVDSRLRLLKKF
jgi:hypothetical protein